jgi:BMFP domain-containing protein YqiC
MSRSARACAETEFSAVRQVAAMAGHYLSVLGSRLSLLENRRTPLERRR